MGTLIAIFAVLQAVGAILGAGGAVWGELSYFNAIADGRLDRAERAHLSVIAKALRWGMLILLVSSIALVLIAFILSNPLQPALTSGYWALMTLALVVIWASWALSRRRVPFWFGSAAIFTGWWMMALLALGRLPLLSYGATVAFAIVACAIIAGVLAYIRSLYPRMAEPREL
ncbi:MAG: hypothetical protein ACREGR_03780 [Minisyncoccia bacterium]